MGTSTTQMVLHLKDGSRNFHLSYQSKDVARVEYNPANGTIQVKFAFFAFLT